MNRITSLTIMSIFLVSASPALAQEPPPPAGSAWSDAVRAVIFADPAKGTLRAPEEIAARWPQLSPEDRALVRADCDASKDVEEEGETAQGSAATDPSPVEDDATTYEPEPSDGAESAAVSLSHVVQVCRVVDGL